MKRNSGIDPRSRMVRLVFDPDLEALASAEQR